MRSTRPHITLVGATNEVLGHEPGGRVRAYDARSARRQFQVSIVLVVVLVLVLAAVALVMSSGRPWLGRLRPAKISVPHVAETLLDIRG